MSNEQRRGCGLPARPVRRWRFRLAWSVAWGSAMTARKYVAQAVPAPSGAPEQTAGTGLHASPVPALIDWDAFNEQGWDYIAATFHNGSVWLNINLGRPATLAATQHISADLWAAAKNAAGHVAPRVHVQVHSNGRSRYVVATVTPMGVQEVGR